MAWIGMTGFLVGGLVSSEQQILSYPVSGEVSYGGTTAGYLPWTRKGEIIPRWIALAESYSGTEYVSVGKTSSPDHSDWDEIIFKFGNLTSGTPILIDSCLHGNEFYSEELNYALMQWVLKAEDIYAQFIKENCCIYNMPCVNYRWGRTNFNVPVWMTTNDPGDGADCGINLNRNFAPTWQSGLSLSNGDDCSGSAPDSENESKALVSAMVVFSPVVYWNLHGGDDYSEVGAISNAITMRNTIDTTLSGLQALMGVTAGSGWVCTTQGYNSIGGVAEDKAVSLDRVGMMTEVLTNWGNEAWKLVSITSGATFNNGRALLLDLAQAATGMEP